MSRGRRRSGALAKTLALVGLCIAFDAASQDDGNDEDIEARFQALEAIIRQQQEQLDAQAELIEELRADRSAGQAAATAAPPAPAEPSPAPGEDDAGEAPALAGATAVSDTRSDGQVAAEAELARRQADGSEGVVNSAQTLYDPSNTIYDPNFPRAWHLPGTTAAMRIGGFVNLSLVNSFDPVLITDRFIVGSIPPDGVVVEGARSGTDVTASQTRLNFEVREQTKHGTLRAFIEGDFFGDGDAFRLRHAFGQFQTLLAGKTWSTFSNPKTLPEEVDIEGVNGAVLKRQPQLRFFPKLGEELSLKVALEEPDTQVANGTGNKGTWDLVASVDRVPLGSLGAWDYEVAFVLRDLKGQDTGRPGDVPESGVPESSATGWGLTTSGRYKAPGWGEQDYLLWQLTFGKGVGRYLNDLGTTGGGDAVFDPDGNLRALPVIGGFLSYRHQWARLPRFIDHWPGLARTNVTFSYVDIDTYDFQDNFDYKRTLRLSGNILYFPTQNLRLGAELLWGRRENANDSDGDATQLQLSARYSF